MFELHRAIPKQANPVLSITYTCERESPETGSSWSRRRQVARSCDAGLRAAREAETTEEMIKRGFHGSSRT